MVKFKSVRFVKDKFYMMDSGFTFSIKEDFSDKLLENYVGLILLNSQKMVYACARGNAQKNLDNSQFKQIKIPLPPIDVQKRIVEEIEGHQKIVEGARAVIDNYKPGVEVEDDWEKVELESVCKKITDGTHRTPTYTNSGVPFWRVTDLTKSNDSKKFISKKEHLELIKRCHPKKGDVLYSKNGTIGVAKLVDWDFEFSTFVSLALLKPKNDLILSKYLEIFMNSDDALRQARAHSKTGAITNLHLINIKQIKVPLPPIEVQKRIVEEIEEEQKLVDASEKLVEIFEGKIEKVIGGVWGKDGE